MTCRGVTAVAATPSLRGWSGDERNVCWVVPATEPECDAPGTSVANPVACPLARIAAACCVDACWVEMCGGRGSCTSSGEKAIGAIVLQEQNRIVAQAIRGSQARDNRAEKMMPSRDCTGLHGRLQKVDGEIQIFGVAILVCTPELRLTRVRLIVLVDTPLKKWSKAAEVAAEDVGSLPAIAQLRRRQRPDELYHCEPELSDNGLK